MYLCAEETGPAARAHSLSSKLAGGAGRGGEPLGSLPPSATVQRNSRVTFLRKVYPYFFNPPPFFPRLHRAARGILVPQPGIKPAPPAVEVRSPNHWTTRDVPQPRFLLAVHPYLSARTAAPHDVFETSLTQVCDQLLIPIPKNIFHLTDVSVVCWFV